MVDLWLPGSQRVVGNSAGAMNGDGSRKILLHSTEGSSIAGAIGAYRDHNSWPTLTVDCRKRRVVQHLPLNVAARALKNASGGVDTNRDGTILVQIELVGFATRPASIGDPDDLDWLGGVLAAIARLTGVPLVSTVRWAAYPASYGLRASQRLPGPDWDSYSGLLGHQHAPENSHGDPGAVDITRILAAARQAAGTTTEDDMDVTDLRTELTTQGTPSRTALRELAQKGTRDALTTGGDPARTAVLELVRKAIAQDGETRDALLQLMHQALDEHDGPGS